MDVGVVIFAVSALCVGAILAGAAGQKIDAPLLLVFLLAGMLAGREGPGGISIDADKTVLVWASAALAAILFEGGLRTKTELFKAGLKPGTTLALCGTLLTALLVAPFAHWAFKLDWSAALLFGAIVSSTDAAAVFALAATGLKLPKRVAAALEVESGFNDPLAIFLVLGMSQALTGDGLSASGWALGLVLKIGLGLIVGAAFGHAAPTALRQVRLPGGLKSILTAGLGFMSFGLAETIGGSGFLAIYITGATIALKSPDDAKRAGAVLDGIAWLSQTGLFLVLGLLITPSHLATVALPALGVSLALIFIARPIAVFASLAGFRFRVRDMTFVAWTGLRGATPVFLGLLPAALGVPNGTLYLSAAAVVVLLSLVIQGWTAPVVGRALHLNEEDRIPVERGETFARLGAVVASIVVGAWFSVALTPKPQAPAAAPGTIAALKQSLSEIESAPASFPPDFSSLPTDERQSLFIATLTAVMDRSNKEVALDRARLASLCDNLLKRGRLTLSEENQTIEIASRYGLQFALPEQLLDHIDIVPTKLAIAQAALATGWGGSQSAVAGNAVFGLNRQSGYDSLHDAARDLTALYAAHADFAPLRQARRAARESGHPPSAEDLALYVGPFAADGKAYVGQVSDVLRSPTLNAATSPARQ